MLDLRNTLFPSCIDLIYVLLLNRSSCHRAESGCHLLQVETPLQQLQTCRVEEFAFIKDGGRDTAFLHDHSLRIHARKKVVRLQDYSHHTQTQSKGIVKSAFLKHCPNFFANHAGEGHFLDKLLRSLHDIQLDVSRLQGLLGSLEVVEYELDLLVRMEEGVDFSCEICFLITYRAFSFIILF